MGQFGKLVSIHCAGSSVRFPDERAYYVRASHRALTSSAQSMCPFLALHVDDGPIVRWVPRDYDRNGWVTIVVTRENLRWWISGLIPVQRGWKLLGQGWFEPTAEVGSLELRLM
jgi:hypothetical protein